MKKKKRWFTTFYYIITMISKTSFYKGRLNPGLCGKQSEESMNIHDLSELIIFSWFYVTNISPYPKALHLFTLIVTMLVSEPLAS